MQSDVPPEVVEFYSTGAELARLTEGISRLERVRTEEILSRFLPPPPAAVVDVGGAAGVYALHLAQRGYEVHLVDPVPLHVEEAKRASQLQAQRPLASARVGEASALAHDNASVDAVLLLGPLYHLVERAARLRALVEARPVLRPDGALIAAAITRLAPLLDGVYDGWIFEDPQTIARTVETTKLGTQTLPGRAGRFTTAYFHTPQELASELREAGFMVDALLGVEGPSALDPRFESRWADAESRQSLLEVARAFESVDLALDVSAHLIAVARIDRDRRVQGEPAAPG